MRSFDPGGRRSSVGFPFVGIEPVGFGTVSVVIAVSSFSGLGRRAGRRLPSRNTSVMPPLVFPCVSTGYAQGEDPFRTDGSGASMRT